MQAPDEPDCKQGKDSERNYGREGKSRSVQSKRQASADVQSGRAESLLGAPLAAFLFSFRIYTHPNCPPTKTHSLTHTHTKVPIVSVQEAFCLKLITG